MSQSPRVQHSTSFSVYYTNQDRIPFISPFFSMDHLNKLTFDINLPAVPKFSTILARLDSRSCGFDGFLDNTHSTCNRVLCLPNLMRRPRVEASLPNFRNLSCWVAEILIVFVDIHQRNKKVFKLPGSVSTKS